MRYVRVQWDRAASVAAVVLGAITLLFGWVGVSGNDATSSQLSYLASGGLFGLFFLGIGGTLWLSADLRDEWRKLDRLQQSTDEVSRLLQEFDASDRPVEFVDLSSAPARLSNNGSPRPVASPTA